MGPGWSDPGVAAVDCLGGELARTVPEKRNNPPRRISTAGIAINDRNQLRMMNLRYLIEDYTSAS
jgi:hypothetical protein